MIKNLSNVECYFVRKEGFTRFSNIVRNDIGQIYLVQYQYISGIQNEKCAVEMSCHKNKLCSIKIEYLHKNKITIFICIITRLNAGNCL